MKNYVTPELKCDLISMDDLFTASVGFGDQVSFGDLFPQHIE